MVFGALVWGAGLLAGYTIFGHRRPLDAVVVVGLALLANIDHDRARPAALPRAVQRGCAAAPDPDPRLRGGGHLGRRKIGDPAAVGRLYFNGGVAFVTAAVLGSILLTATASSAPLQGLWRDLPKHLQGLSQLLQAIARPAATPGLTGGPTFNSNVTTSGKWNPSQQVAFLAQLPAGEDATFKWRARRLRPSSTCTAGRGDPTATTPDAGRRPARGAADQPSTTAGGRSASAITPEAYRDQTILGPNAIAAVDRRPVAKTLGEEGWFATVESTEEIGPYTVTALIPVARYRALTEAKLRAASTAIPTGLRDDLPPAARRRLGPEARRLLATIKAAVTARRASTRQPLRPGTDDGALPLQQRELRSTTTTSRTSGGPAARPPRSSASRSSSAATASTTPATMAVLLRQRRPGARRLRLPDNGGEPRRRQRREVGGWLGALVGRGLLPGRTAGSSSIPTGGEVGQQVPLPSGSVGPSTPRPSGNFAIPPARPGSSGGPTVSPGTTPTTPDRAVHRDRLILMIGVGALAFAAYRRTPSRPMHPTRPGARSRGSPRGSGSVRGRRRRSTSTPAPSATRCRRHAWS